MSNMKCKTVDAVNHRETKALMQRMNASLVPRSSVAGLETVRQQAMEAIAAVKSVTQAGLLPVAAITTAYVGHIRQMDRQTQTRQPPRNPHAINQGMERLE